MVQTIKMNLDDTEHLTSIAKALSINTRIEILKQLRIKDMNVNEIAEVIGIPASSAASHVKVLEEAGVIKTTLLPGIRGSMKVCHIILDEIYIGLSTVLKGKQDVEIIRMPIGNFVDYKVDTPCGIVGTKGPIAGEDNPKSFFHPDHVEAKLIWIGNGYLEYRFPNSCLNGKIVSQLELSAEVCSEDHEYNLDFPSDITLWVNGIEIGTYACPSDFGGRRGKLNPDWWPDKNTQYGVLKNWKITKSGCFIDEKKMNDTSLEQFNLEKDNYITVRIGIKEDATHRGGLNLFGDCFGDYAQNITMMISFE